MATANEIIKGALRLNQALTRGENLPAEDAQEALIALNDLLHSMYADNSLVPFLTREQLTLTVGKSEYTIGSGGDFSTTRPMSIATIVLRDTDTDFYIEELSQQWWAALDVKGDKTRPQQFYYEEGYPTGTIYFDHAPDQAYTMYLTSYKPHTEFTQLADTVNLPPMYEKYLRFQLAADLAPEYGMEAPQTVLRQAQRARLAIVQRNMGNRPSEMQVDDALTAGGSAGYDIRSDS